METNNDRDGLATRLSLALLEAGLAALNIGVHKTSKKHLKSAFAALLHNNQASNHATLLGLPGELRLEIFDYLLRPGDVYVRWSARAAHHDVRFSHILEEWDSQHSPDRWLPLQQVRYDEPPRSPTRAEVQIFLVCKQLRDEGVHYYLTKNTFHLMGTDCALPYLS